VTLSIHSHPVSVVFHGRVKCDWGKIRGEWREFWRRVECDTVIPLSPSSSGVSGESEVRLGARLGESGGSSGAEADIGHHSFCKLLLNSAPSM